jgi:hypothetical protein
MNASRLINMYCRLSGVDPKLIKRKRRLLKASKARAAWYRDLERRCDKLDPGVWSRDERGNIQLELTSRKHRKTSR